MNHLFIDLKAHAEETALATAAYRISSFNNRINNTIRIISFQENWLSRERTARKSHRKLSIRSL